MAINKKVIKIYQKINTAFRALGVPFFTYTTCKFYPSCSEYAELAIERHGVAKGGLMAAGRIVRCNPFNKGGVDYP